MDANTFIHNQCIELGKQVLRMTTAAGSGHPTSALSIIHIVVTLMRDVMRYDPADPWHPGSDRLVLSEGHAVPAVYAAYASVGGVVCDPPAVGQTTQSDSQSPAGPAIAHKRASRKLTFSELSRLREIDSPLDGHPNPAEGFPFFDAATGSLGQGLSAAAGLAVAARMRKMDRRIFVIIGDGESREGQIWEAMDFIAEQKLTNVVAVFNCNGQGQSAHVSEQQSPDALAAKARAFGWDVETIDGHDPASIRKTLSNADRHDRPLAVIAKTVKGWGCRSIQDQSNHGKPVSAERLEAACGELDAMRETLGIDKPQHASAEEAGADPVSITPPPPAEPMARRSIAAADFQKAIKDAGLESALAKGKLATRRAYGAALLALAEADPRIVALDGDVSNSTFSNILGKKHPQRFVECKIAEQNMVSAAVGLSAAGFIPFLSTFAKFVARAYDQIEMAQITRANVKIVGSHAGVSLAADGPSQMSLHDVAYFRCAGKTDNSFGRPACTSFQPCDAVAAYHCTVLMANCEGVCYMRTHRPDVPLIYSPETTFEIGGSHRLAEGDALTLVTAGYMVHVCKEAMVLLAAEGIACTLIDAYSFPLHAAPILQAASKAGKAVLCVEDNYAGGLGGAVAEAAAEVGDIHVASMTCRRIPKSAKTPAQIMSYVGLAPTDIAAEARRMIG